MVAVNKSTNHLQHDCNVTLNYLSFGFCGEHTYAVQATRYIPTVFFTGYMLLQVTWKEPQ